jgi:predicted permease
MPDFAEYVRERLGSLDLSLDREGEVVEEIAEHMRASYEAARGRGVSEREALEIAESSFVPWENLRRSIAQADRKPTAESGPEDCGRSQGHRGTATRIKTIVASLWQDVRFGMRTFGKRPLFTAVAIGTLGLGIGATTTMFSVVDGVLLRQLPFDKPAELVTVWKTWPHHDWTGGLFWREFAEFRDNATSFTSFQEAAVHRPERMVMTGSGEPATLLAGVASASLFPMLGVRPQLGRVFQPGEDGPDAVPVVMLSGELWRNRFGSDSSVIGQTITLDEAPYEVIGVLPPGFRLRGQSQGAVLHEIETGVNTGERDVWLPVGFNGDDLQSWSMNLEFVGRLSPGVTVGQARSEVRAALQRGREQDGMEVRLASLKEDDTAGFQLPLLLLLGAAGVLSLVACANVANLLLGEAIGRQREMKTRVALGGSRFRVARLLLTESVLLGLAGGLLGLAVAIVCVRTAVSVGPYLPGLETVRIDYRVLLFSVSLGVLTGIVFGLAPAVRSARLAPSVFGNGGSRFGGDRFQRRVLALVFALTTVLLVAGGLLTRSFANLVQLDTGFDARNVATIRLPVLPSRYEELEPRNAFLARVLAEIETIPGVIQASGADNLPFPGTISAHKIEPVGREDSLRVPLRRVLADYHEVMGIRLVAGRFFDERDVEGNTPVMIVSEAVARIFWPGESALGATLYHRGYGELTVVGVVGEVLEGWVGTEARPMVYVPLAQARQEEISFLARTAGDPAPVIPLLRDAVWAVDPDVAVTMETTLESLVADSSLSERYRTLLVGFFGLSAFLLAAVGIFGVTGRNIALRKRELGVRVALGATEQGLVGVILRESLTTALVGTAVGLVVALWVSRLLAGFLFGVGPTDPLSYAVVVTLLVGVCLFAGYLPARRIAKVDPVEVLKAE